MSYPTTLTNVVISDEAIVARVLAGEVALFEVLIRRNNRRLYRAVRATLGRVDDDEVLDVVQDAYVRAYAHLGTFEGRARFSTWLTRIAVFEALARRRRWRANHPVDDANEKEAEMDDTTRPPDPERQAATGEIRRVIEGAVEALPESFRTVFMLRAVEEMSVAETAECLDIPEDTVRTRLHRARALLQQSLLAQLEAGASTAFPFDGARCERITAAVLRRLRPPPRASS